MMSKIAKVAATLCIAGAIVSPAVAQQFVDDGKDPFAPAPVTVSKPTIEAVPPSISAIEPRWGTSAWVAYTLGPADFVTREGCSLAGTLERSNLISVGPASGQTSACIGASPHLPTGAHIGVVRVQYYDNTTASDPSIGLWDVNPINGADTSIVSLTPPSYSGGYHIVDFATDYTVANNFTHIINVLAILSRSGALTERITGVTFWYTLQISPAPSTATFNDVSTGHWAFQYIEALKASGITTGTSATTFSPNGTVSRAEMAVFLAKALGLHYPN